jgi:hypothetical protein
MALAMAVNSAEIFVYTGIGEGSVVPSDVVRVRIDPSVLAIPDYAFNDELRQLQEVELHDGLREIGQQAFMNCQALKEVQLPDGVERIGSYAFHSCIRFTKFRSPPLVTTIPNGMLNHCPRMLVTRNYLSCRTICVRQCGSVRNVALTSNTVVAVVDFYTVQTFIIFSTR